LPDGTVSVSAMLPLHEERLLVSKRVRKTLVRAARTSTHRTVAVDEDLAIEQVVVTRVPIGRVVEAVPPVREENGVTVVPVVEEELRRQEVTVTRTAVTE